jgi:hypothetical protein
MKIMSLLGASLAIALLCAFPASAAVAPSYDLVARMAAPIDECVVSLAVDNAILFVEATQDMCDATMAELTGLCLAPASESMPAYVAAVLAPDLDISCTTGTRPSPPG